MTSIRDFLMSPEIGRVSSSKVPLNVQEETRFEGLAEEAVMIDVHQHPFVLPEAMDRFIDFLRTNRYHWGFEAVKHGGWSTVTTSNVLVHCRMPPRCRSWNMTTLLSKSA